SFRYTPFRLDTKEEGRRRPNAPLSTAPTAPHAAARSGRRCWAQADPSGGPMSEPTPAVALRAAGSAAVDEVRAGSALAEIPLVIHPPGADPPAAALLLDSAAEVHADDPPWVGPSRRAAWVGHTGTERTTAQPQLELPEAGERLLTLARSACRRRTARVIG